VRARADGGDAATLHFRDAVVRAPLLSERPSVYELSPAEPLREPLLGRDGDQRLGQVARASRLPPELTHPGGEEERDAHAERMGPRAREVDEHACAELRIVGLAAHPRHHREIALRDGGRIVAVAQRVRAVALDVVDLQHRLEVTPRAVRLSVPEADLPE